MILPHFRANQIIAGILTTCLLFSYQKGQAQFTEGIQKDNSALFHGIEQYNQNHYGLSKATLSSFLREKPTGIDDLISHITHAEPNTEKGKFYFALSSIRDKDVSQINYIANHLDDFASNRYYYSNVAFYLGQYYFSQEQLPEAIKFYTKANVAHLSNEQVADQKFELAYCYFNESQFDLAKPLFKSIKEIPGNKYYIPGNYYYGLLAYNDKDFDEALKSFQRIDNQPGYAEVVPYYEAEINYFKGNPERVLRIAQKYLKQGDLYYTKDMQLLMAQTLFERKDYQEALPHFEAYYNVSTKIRKEVLYEIAYTYYRLDNWPMAVKRFQPLSNSKDSLGQTSMYLLGDCYLKMNDKKGARSAFQICSNMDFNPSQKEAATFLYGKLSDELGDKSMATNILSRFIETYPNSDNIQEAQKILARLFTQSNNYVAAFNIMSKMPVKDEATWQMYQKVAVGSGLQEMQNNHLKSADSILSLSLQQPADPAYEAVAYFWKGEIGYQQGNYQNAILFNQNFLNKYPAHKDAIKSLSEMANPTQAQLTIGAAQMKLGDFAAAQKAFKDIQTSAKGDNGLTTTASLNEADAFFMQKDFANAAPLYTKVAQSNSSYQDYANYQLALISGLKNDELQKKTLLQNIINKVPASDYKYKAQYELATTLLNEGKNTEAINALKNIVNNPSVPDELKAPAQTRLAFAYQQTGDYESAKKAYKDYLIQYPADSGRANVLDALSTIYIAQSQPEGYVNFLKENNLPMPADSSLEKTFYDAAIQKFSQDDWEKSAEGFTKYLDNFPNGLFATKAYFYRGSSFDKLNKSKEAIADFDKVLKAGWSEFAPDAALYAAALSFGNKDYEEAYGYYGQLRDFGKDEDTRQTAYTGLMKTAYLTQKPEVSMAYADTLLSLPELPANAKAEALLFKARINQNQNNLQEADSIYQVLGKQNIGDISAEARFRQAEIAYTQNDLKKAEDLAAAGIKAGSSQNYWVVKCYILIGDIFKDQKDYFNAKATLSSVVANTKYEDLKEIAQEKLSIVQGLEKETSKLEQN